MATKYLLILALSAAVFSELFAADKALVTYLDNPSSYSTARTLREKDSGVIYYVESDGRHVAAIDKDGKLLWLRDPFVDAKLEPYRVKHPVIVGIRSPNDWMIKGREGRFVCINFDSSQCVIMSVTNGDSIWMGQD